MEDWLNNRFYDFSEEDYKACPDLQKISKYPSLREKIKNMKVLLRISYEVEEAKKNNLSTSQLDKSQMEKILMNKSYIEDSYLNQSNLSQSQNDMDDSLMNNTFNFLNSKEGLAEEL